MANDSKMTVGEYMNEVRRASPKQELSEINPERLEIIFSILGKFELEPEKTERIGLAIETALTRWESSKSGREEA